MPHYIYSDSLLTAVHRAMWTPLLLTLDIGGGRGNACEREEVLTSVLQKRRLTNEFEFFLYLMMPLLKFYYFTEDNRSIYIINLLGREVIRAFKEGNSFPVAPPHNDKW